jgi:hypothetical protein
MKNSDIGMSKRFLQGLNIGASFIIRQGHSDHRVRCYSTGKAASLPLCLLVIAVETMSIDECNA